MKIGLLGGKICFCFSADSAYPVMDSKFIFGKNPSLKGMIERSQLQRNKDIYSTWYDIHEQIVDCAE